MTIERLEETLMFSDGRWQSAGWRGPDRLLLRPRSGGRVFPWTFHSSIGDYRRWEIRDGVSVVAGRTYDTRAQAAQAVWEG